MATEHHFYMDTDVSRHALRDALVQADIGFNAQPDFEYLSNAHTVSTDVTLRNESTTRAGRPDNGVVATRVILFRDTRRYLTFPEIGHQFNQETTRGIMALLRAFPVADAYWEGWDARVPILRRRAGRLVLSQAEATGSNIWDPDRQPFRALVDLPYVVEPLGPWDYIDIVR